MSSNFIKVGHVFVHKDDKVSDYPPSIFTDPQTFVPFKNEITLGYPDEDDLFNVEEEEEEDEEENEKGDQKATADVSSANPVQKLDETKEYCVLKWGLKDPSTQRPNQMLDFISNMMQGQSKSLKMYNKEYPTPDIQFINLLAKERKKTLKSAEMQELCKAMYRVRIMIKGAEELCYRVFTVPASTHLNVLHDQIIVPIMGWCRGMYLLLYYTIASKLIHTL